MNGIDLSLGKLVSSNPYVPLVRKALEQTALTLEPGMRVHPIQLAADFLVASGNVSRAIQGGVQGRMKRGWHWKSVLTTPDPTMPGALAQAFAEVLVPILIALEISGAPDQLVEQALDEALKFSAGATVDPGGVTGWLVEATSHMVNPRDPMSHIHALVAVLAAAAYSGVVRDEVFAAYALLLEPTRPAPALLVTP